MRVRVWISGADGPSRDFELVDAPRVGEHISISVGGHIEDGVVLSVSWHLVGIEYPAASLALAGEPVGSVAFVHVVCGPPTFEALKAVREQEDKVAAQKSPEDLVVPPGRS